MEHADEGMSEATLRTVTALVQDTPWLLRIPENLAAGLEARRSQTFGRLLGPGTPFVIGLTLAVSLSGIPLFHVGLDTHDGRVWWHAEAFTLVSALIGLVVVRRPGMLEHYTTVVAITSAFVLAAKLFETIAFQDQAMALYASYVCALTTNLIMLAFRSPPLLAVASCLGGTAICLVAAQLTGVPIEISPFHTYVAASTCVSLGVAHFSERQDRINYLQSLLLAHESAKSRKLNEELAQIARTDPLTAIANRRHFDLQLRAEWDRARRERTNVALLYIDIDHFKAFNDAYGHPAGDECLAAVARAINSSSKRPADLAARYGGEEFVLLLPSTDLAGAETVAASVLSAVDGLAIEHRASGTARFVTVSVGIASLSAVDHPDERELVRAADEALYRAKSEGRHRVSLPPPPLAARG
jgi:diguanylate cyclase (GGDEF)-like protein